jgi:hypothetical protein
MMNLVATTIEAMGCAAHLAKDVPGDAISEPSSSPLLSLLGYFPLFPNVLGG